MLGTPPQFEQLTRRDNAEHGGDDRPEHAQSNIEDGSPPFSFLKQRDSLIAEGGKGGVAAAEASREESPDFRREARGGQRVVEEKAQQQRTAEVDHERSDRELSSGATLNREPNGVADDAPDSSTQRDVPEDPHSPPSAVGKKLTPTPIT